jgi:uracil phosphoribosyltransferase
MTRQTQFPTNTIIEVNHPLVQDKLTKLRDINTDKKAFKELAYEITLLLAYEATKQLPLTQLRIQTPLESFDAPVLAVDTPIIVPILRAGIGMVDAFLTLMPTAKVGHIGLYRDEKTFEPHRYFFKLPKFNKTQPFFICDPMLATAGSAIATISELKKEHVSNITLVCIVCAPEGIQSLIKAHPDVSLYTAAIDRELNKNGYILPGLGDAGDRLFGTL